MAIPLTLHAAQGVGGHDPRKYKPISHSHLPISIYIPIHWESKQSLTGKKYEWALKPENAYKSVSKPPKILLNIVKLSEVSNPIRNDKEGNPNLNFLFGNQDASGTVEHREELWADIEREGYYFNVRAWAYTDEDRTLVKEILKHIDIEDPAE